MVNVLRINICSPFAFVCIDFFIWVVSLIWYSDNSHTVLICISWHARVELNIRHVIWETKPCQLESCSDLWYNPNKLNVWFISFNFSIALLPLQTVEFAQTYIYICFKREVIRDIYIRQILNKPADDEGEIVENKTGANISRSDSTDLKHI